MKGLVSVHFLATINIYVVGNKALSKNVMREFFSQSFYASLEHI